MITVRRLRRISALMTKAYERGKVRLADRLYHALLDAHAQYKVEQVPMLLRRQAS